MMQPEKGIAGCRRWKPHVATNLVMDEVMSHRFQSTVLVVRSRTRFCLSAKALLRVRRCEWHRAVGLFPHCTADSSISSDCATSIIERAIWIEERLWKSQLVGLSPVPIRQS